MSVGKEKKTEINSLLECPYRWYPHGFNINIWNIVEIMLKYPIPIFDIKFSMPNSPVNEEMAWRLTEKVILRQGWNHEYCDSKAGTLPWVYVTGLLIGLHGTKRTQYASHVSSPSPS